MARVEERKVPILGKVAWIPRGPAIVKGRNFAEFEKEFVELLKQKVSAWPLMIDMRQLIFHLISKTRPRSKLPGSAELLYELNSETLNNRQSATLFLARYKRGIVEEAMMVRSGKHLLINSRKNGK